MSTAAPSPALLAPQEVEVLDSACKPLKKTVTRQSIEYDVAALLRAGLTTSSAGGFFFIPYLLQLHAHELLGRLGPIKKEGIPNERLALGIVFESLFGFTSGIRSIDSVSRADFGLLSGLPFLPSPSAQYRYLQDVPYNDALAFQVGLGRQLVALGQVLPGSAINVDAHNSQTYSRKEMKRSFLPREERYGKAIRAFYTQDQDSRKPLIAMAAYSGTTVCQTTRRLADATRQILGDDFLMVADKEWYCARLIQELHQQQGISILTPVKCSSARVAEFDAVPLSRYAKTAWGDIAALYTTMNGFQGPLRMLLKKRPDGKYFALITPESEMTADTAMPTYTKRWRIEQFNDENTFLGVDHLPSLNLNAIQTALSLRLLAFQVLDNFRRDLGPEHCHKTPELIHRHFVDGVQGRIQLHDNFIEVTVYGFQHQAAVASLFTNIDAQLERRGIDPRIPWLGNRRLHFQFR